MGVALQNGPVESVKQLLLIPVRKQPPVGRLLSGQPEEVGHGCLPVKRSTSPPQRRAQREVVVDRPAAPLHPVVAARHQHHAAERPAPQQQLQHDGTQVAAGVQSDHAQRGRRIAGGLGEPLADDGLDLRSEIGGSVQTQLFENGARRRSLIGCGYAVGILFQSQDVEVVAIGQFLIHIALRLINGNDVLSNR